MIEDRNKTGIAKAVTAAAVRYLDERGCKPIETEVSICDSWVADIAGMVVPTQTELIGLKLLKRRPNYMHPQYEAWNQLAIEMQKLMTVLVEVKTSRSDFRSDKKWSRPIPANLAYLAFPKGLSIGIDEIPQGWGLLEYSEGSDCVKCWRPPVIINVTTDEQLCVIHQIAVRRDHHTRYARHREFQKGMLNAQNESISRTRVVNAMCAMISIVRGKYGSVEDALSYHGIKHMPEYHMGTLRKLWAIQPETKATKVVAE